MKPARVLPFARPPKPAPAPAPRRTPGGLSITLQIDTQAVARELLKLEAEKAANSVRDWMRDNSERLTALAGAK